MKHIAISSILIALTVNVLATCLPLPAEAVLNMRVRPNNSASCGKPFNNAMVLAGGGLTPGVTLGLLAGAQAAGHKPDVVIATCGSSIGTAIANAYPNPKDAKEFVKSRKFHQYLKQNLKLGSTSPFALGTKLNQGGSINQVAPNIFDQNLLEVPESLRKLLPNQSFTARPGQPRFVTVAARANFSKEDAGRGLVSGALYQQVYFTDSSTAKSLRGLPASIKRNFPQSPIDPDTDVVTGVDMLQAARASIADPYMMNPAKIGKDFYFAGAMDLFPVETAQAIACNSTVTASSGEYSGIEDQAVEKGFGFSQTARVRQLSQYKGVRWVNTKGVADLAMDPTGGITGFQDNVPDSYEEFAEQIERQYQLGFERAQRAYGITEENPPTAYTSGRSSR